MPTPSPAPPPHSQLTPNSTPPKLPHLKTPKQPQNPQTTSKPPNNLNSPNSTPNLVFLHGFRGNNSGLKQLAPFFPDCNTFFPTLPPASGQTLPEYTPKSYNHFLKNYLLSHHITKPILIGHSMGTIIAANFAAAHPDLLADHLILLAPISQNPHPLFISLQPLILLAPSRFITYATTKYLFVPKKSPALFRSTLQTSHACATAYHHAKRPLLKSARFSSRHSIQDFDLRNSHKQILLIAGATDRLIPQTPTIALAHHLNAKLHIIKNTGHLLNYEAPATIATLIRNFLHLPPLESPPLSSQKPPQ